MITGKVFDIRRFSTHDGDGIRTTVFLKGCPLRCIWCQNPEGISFEDGPVHFSGRCIHCKTCLQFVREGGIREQNGEIRLDRDRKEDWDRIIDACPSGAIAMDAKEYEPEELVEELLKDEVFFRRGGGVTLSGGEPLAQPVFAAKVLKGLKDRGIHTAVETALGVLTETVKMILPYLDLIYADMKIADEQEHIKYTGVSNRLIRENLAYILTSPYKEKAVIRTPLIPDCTASKKNLEEIASFLSSLYPEVRYELLNYNPLAEAKYHLVNRIYCFRENPKPYTREQMKAFGETVRRNGIRNLIMEI